MKLSKIAGFAFALMLMAGISTAHAAGAYGTKAEAQAMAEKAAAHYKAGGDSVLPDFQKKDGEYMDRDLYVFVVSNEGKFKAHGGNAGLVGKSGLALKDITGFEIIKAFIKAPSNSWVDYKWTSPTEEGKLKSKSSYIIKVGDDIVGVGCYTD